MSDKHKKHRSSLKNGYYTQQFARTERNKLRRKMRIARRKAAKPQVVSKLLKHSTQVLP